MHTAKTSLHGVRRGRVEKRVTAWPYWQAPSSSEVKLGHDRSSLSSLGLPPQIAPAARQTLPSDYRYHVVQERLQKLHVRSPTCPLEGRSEGLEEWLL